MVMKEVRIRIRSYNFTDVAKLVRTKLLLPQYTSADLGSHKEVIVITLIVCPFCNQFCAIHAERELSSELQYIAWECHSVPHDVFGILRVGRCSEVIVSG